MPLLNELARKPFDDDRAYDQVVHILHVMVVEPHPLAPDPSPYTGKVWETKYSSILQPLTHPERVAAAMETAALLAGNQLLVVDDLEPGSRVNPVWCTYGPTPNSAYLIQPDGTIRTAWTWLDVDALEAAIDEQLR